MAYDPSDLSAYLDGELSREASRDIEAWIASDLGVAQEFDQLKRSSLMIAQCIEKPGFHPDLALRIHAAEARIKVRRMAFRSALAAAAILLVAVAGFLFYPRPAHEVPATHGAVSAPQPMSPVPEGDASKLAAAVPAQTQAPEKKFESTRLPLELIGTVTGAAPMAVIDVKEGPKKGSQVFQSGDTLLDGVKLVEVRQDEAVLDDHGQQVVLKRGVPAPEKAPDLNGSWKVTLQSQGMRAVEVGEVKIEQNGPSIKLLDGKDVAAEGRITGRCIELAATREPFSLLGSLRGGITPDLMHADIPLASLPADLEKMFAPNDTGEAPSGVHLCLDRVVPRPGDPTELQKARLQEVKAMAEVIIKCVVESRYVQSLDELVPHYALTLSQFADTDTRKVQYIPGLRSPNVRPDNVVTDEMFKPDPALPYPDGLMKCDQALREIGYEQRVVVPVMLRVTYSNPDETYAADTHARARRIYSAADLADPGIAGMVRAACQNNLKQLGLIIKMFENENKNYTPPSWIYTFPEYITDPTILTSPKDDLGTDSYLYLCPATNIAEYVKQNSSDLDPASQAKLLAQIPTVMNRTDFPNPPGRNVLFADGHVEYVRAAEVRALEQFWSKRP